MNIVFLYTNSCQQTKPERKEFMMVWQIKIGLGKGSIDFNTMTARTKSALYNC